MSDLAAIDLTLTYAALAFTIEVTSPDASLDGRPLQPSWKQPLRLPVSPGQHTLTASFPWLLRPQAGLSGVTVDVPAGHVVGLTWKAPQFVWSKGKWATEAPAPLDAAGLAALANWAQQVGVAPGAAPPQLPTAGPPAGWHPDPHGRHQLRYWDGATWTQHVSDDGAQGVDPT